ncbi:hypothetical protein K2173_027087 [Erythroxylum novogranatense]|uniref:CASP-like protein n=1 Tax=Erythroxylum novogranatense TaxID=1862640 RepID=A0AAV8TY80_9ROSI|nr:hypothetical protein K2173_027087 [Erythroxylum novogranatense]
MAFKIKSVACSILLLRIFALCTSVACLLVLVINSVTPKVLLDKYELNTRGSKLTFKYVTAYRYEFFTAFVGALYSLMQIPFATYHAYRAERMINNRLQAELDFYGDQVITLVLATGVTAGFTYSIEFKYFINALYDNAGIEDENVLGSRSSYNTFLNGGLVATIPLFIGFIAMAILSVLSSLNRGKG